MKNINIGYTTQEKLIFRPLGDDAASDLSAVMNRPSYRSVGHSVFLLSAVGPITKRQIRTRDMKAISEDCRCTGKLIGKRRRTARRKDRTGLLKNVGRSRHIRANTHRPEWQNTKIIDAFHPKLSPL